MGASVGGSTEFPAIFPAAAAYITPPLRDEMGRNGHATTVALRFKPRSSGVFQDSLGSSATSALAGFSASMATNSTRDGDSRQPNAMMPVQRR